MSPRPALLVIGLLLVALTTGPALAQSPEPDGSPAPSPVVSPAATAEVTPDAPPASPDRPVGPPAATPIADPPRIPAGDGTGVRLSTELGDIVIGLFTETAPVASENFLNLVGAGYYDGLTFHRLVPGFVIQGGDPAGDGTGGPGYTIPDEPVVGRYARGIVAMARTPAPDSQGSQFFIVLDDGAEGPLEMARTYTIFGRVLEGMDIVDAIASMPNTGDPENRALEPVRIGTATVEKVEMQPEPDPGTPPEPQGPDGAPDLEALMPATIGDSELPRISFTGEDLFEGVAPGEPLDELRLFIQDAGLAPSDLAIASAQAEVPEGFVGIFLARLAGRDPQVLAERLPPLLLGTPGEPPEATTIAGRDVSIIAAYADAPPEESLHIWVDGDVLWIVVAPEPYLSQLAAAGP
jgi:cyclophilin family peptidyl-prolyl cis-trans isomerase